MSSGPGPWVPPGGDLYQDISQPSCPRQHGVPTSKAKRAAVGTALARPPTPWGPATTSRGPAASQRPPPSARLGVFICLPLSLSPRRKHYLTITLLAPARFPAPSCQVYPAFSSSPPPAPRSLAMFAFLSPAAFPLPPPGARSLLHPPREAASRAKVSLCQVPHVRPGAAGQPGPPCRPPPGSLLSAASPRPGGAAVCCSGSARDAPAHQRARFPSQPPAHPFCCWPGAGQTLLCLVLRSLDRSGFVGCLLLPGESFSCL